MSVIKEADITHEKVGQSPELGFSLHTYQPEREFRINISDPFTHEASFSVVPEVNDQITEESYRPIFGEGQSLSPGLSVSLYATLRAYLKKNQPQLFTQIQHLFANTPNKEYKLLGDPFIHAILPLLSQEDQEMLTTLGRQAFEEDLGFFPEGIWLPETAVSKETLRVIRKAGHSFVLLRDDQVKFPDGIVPDAKHNICLVDLENGEEISVVLFNKKLSGAVALETGITADASQFMEARRQREARNGWNGLMAMDTETFNHHIPGSVGFLQYILEHMKEYGFEPFDLKKGMQRREKTVVEVKDNSSWSCEHGIGRWTGDPYCSCDNPSHKARQDKRYFYETLSFMNEEINRILNMQYPDWRQDFMDVVFPLRDGIFTGVNFGPAFVEAVHNKGGNAEYTKLLLAKLEVFIGMTSCGWFFGSDDRPEREIPASMIKAVEDLLRM
ncbi:MAG: hypothetical protein WC489_03390 [Patescibacteria group bacterium]